MKIARVLSMALAGVFSIQQIALATDRTTGIGDPQLAEARAELARLRTQLMQLDATLEQAAAEIQTSSKSGQNFARFGTLAAGTAVTLSALTVLQIQKRNQMMMMLSGGLTMLSTGLSSLFALVSSAQKDRARLQISDADLAKAQSQIRMEARQANATANAADRRQVDATKLDQLDATLSQIRQTLKEYESRQDLLSQGHLISLISQAAGLGLSISMTSLGRSPIFGALAFSAGNLGQLIVAMTPEQKDLVLTEITKTRQVIHNVARTLPE